MLVALPNATTLVARDFSARADHVLIRSTVSNETPAPCATPRISSTYSGGMWGSRERAAPAASSRAGAAAATSSAISAANFRP